MVHQLNPKGADMFGEMCCDAELKWYHFPFRKTYQRINIGDAVDSNEELVTVCWFAPCSSSTCQSSVQQLGITRSVHNSENPQQQRCVAPCNDLRCILPNVSRTTTWIKTA